MDLAFAQGWCADEAKSMAELVDGDQHTVAQGSTFRQSTTDAASFLVDNYGVTSPSDAWVDPLEWDPDTLQEWSTFLKKAKLNKVCCDAFPSHTTPLLGFSLSLYPLCRVIILRVCWPGH